MARRTKEQKQETEVSDEFPYREFITHPAWPVIENALRELESNDDLELRTAQRYVVGFLIKQLALHDLMPPAAPHQLNGEKKRPKRSLVLSR
jgi:hypothetical protein